MELNNSAVKTTKEIEVLLFYLIGYQKILNMDRFKELRVLFF